ncbi:MFS transporter [Streptomyces phaeochromogenes]|uniref:MFS transporter n=1 Tax=Streptomyces phaeochromogenes TaxID=1923 RepID=UPI002DD9EA75|nr:MFS transporter [Streptomyces phaeochromogenes]WRZ34598.1 MFS transporter [Streptomyces phaeochromogenes]
MTIQERSDDVSENSPERGGVSGFREFAVIAALMFSAMPFLLAESLYSPALPAFAAHYDKSISDVSWLLTGHTLFAAVITPVAGRLGDLYGRGKLLVVVITVTGIGAVVSATAPDLTVVIIGRVLQGATVAAVPLALSVVRDALRPERVGLGVSLLSAVFGVGGGFGFLFSGRIVDNLGLDWLAWSVAIVAAIGVLLLLATVYHFKPSAAGGRKNVDWYGSLLLAVALVPLLLHISKGTEWGWLSSKGLMCLALSLLGAAAFTKAELTVKHPMVDLRALSRRAVWSLNLPALADSVGSLGANFLIPQLVVIGAVRTDWNWGQTATDVGTLMLAGSIGILLGGPLTNVLKNRIDHTTMLAASFAIFFVEYTMIALFHGTHAMVAMALFLGGVGFGICSAAVANLVIRGVEPSLTAVTMAANYTLRLIGGSILVQALAAILTTSASSHGGAPTETAFRTAAFTCAGLVLLGGLSTRLIPRGADHSALAPVR